jgi:hypothetical protein
VTQIGDGCCPGQEGPRRILHGLVDPSVGYGKKSGHDANAQSRRSSRGCLGGAWRAARVCKTWRRVLYRDPVWLSLARRFNVEVPPDATDVRKVVAEAMGSVTVKIVTLFHHRMGTSLSGDFVITLRRSTPVRNFLAEVNKANDNRQAGTNQAYDPNDCRRWNDEAPRALPGPDCSWPFTSADSFSWSASTNAALDAPIGKYLKNRTATLAQQECMMCD